MRAYARKRVRPYRGAKMSLLLKSSYLVSGRTRTGFGIQTGAPEYPGGEHRRKLNIQMVSKESDLKKARGLWKFVPTKNFRPIVPSTRAAFSLLLRWTKHRLSPSTTHQPWRGASVQS